MGITSTRSFATQFSVCFAVGGLGNLLSVGSKGGKNELPVINSEHAVTKAILARIAGFTDIEVQSVAGSNSEE